MDSIETKTGRDEDPDSVISEAPTRLPELERNMRTMSHLGGVLTQQDVELGHVNALAESRQEMKQPAAPRA